MSYKTLLSLLIVSLLTPALLADWKEPADGKISEKQATAYFAAMKDYVKTLKAAGKAMEGAGGAGSLAMMARTNEKLKTVIAKSGMSEDEFNWVAGKTWEAFVPATLIAQWEEKEKPAMEAQLKKNTESQDALKKRIAELEAAKKSGDKVLTKEQREEAIRNATSERDQIKDELKSKNEEIQGVKDEAAGKEKEAKAKDAEAADFDKLAKKPPSDVTDENKAGYIEEQQNNAKAARDAAAEIRSGVKETLARIPDLQKEADAIKARLAVAEGKIAHPEKPVTDEEKEQLAKDNAEALKQANSELEQTVEAGKMLKETLDAGPKQYEALFNQGDKKIPDENVQIMRKHLNEWQEIWGK